MAGRPASGKLGSGPAGPIIALRFVAVVDEPGRFRQSHDVMSYLGLTPGENSSSTRKQRTGITKAGASDLRFALVQVRGAHSAFATATPWCAGLSSSLLDGIARLPSPLSRERWWAFCSPFGATAQPPTPSAGSRRWT